MTDCYFSCCRRLQSSYVVDKHHRRGDWIFEGLRNEIVLMEDHILLTQRFGLGKMLSEQTEWSRPFM